MSKGSRTEWRTIQGVIGQVTSNALGRFEIIFLFQLKLDSLPGHYVFIDFHWLSCGM